MIAMPSVVSSPAAWYALPTVPVMVEVASTSRVKTATRSSLTACELSAASQLIHLHLLADIFVRGPVATWRQMHTTENVYRWDQYS